MVPRLVRLLLVGSVLLLLVGGGMAVVMLVGLGAGACLNLLVPGIDLGLGAVVGVLALLTVLLAFGQFVGFAVQARAAAEPSDDEEIDDALSEEQIEDLADAVAQHMVTFANQRGRRPRSRPRSK